MSLIVMKFGGTSMAGIERIRNVARHVKRETDAGHSVAVVVSAMAGETDRLIGLVGEAAMLPDEAEYDSIVSTGEQVSSGLLAITLQSLGQKARSWLGWQLPVRTNGAHGKARILDIEASGLKAALAAGEVAVIPGFQGLAEDGRITTLGRGGSDTSAVAVAAALKADRCDIYTDVTGVYTTDPRIDTRARKLDRITYEEMLELASVGAKVLQTRSVELAMKEKVRLQVLSSLTSEPGTLVVDEDEVVEHELITGVAYDRNQAKITLTKVLDRPGIVAGIFGPLADSNINVDMIVQNIASDGKMTDVTFTVPRTDLARARAVIENEASDIEYDRLEADDTVAKISIVGVGMRSNAGVAVTMFRTLAERGINILAITTSEIKISVLIDEEYLELAVRVLHTAFNLDSEA